MACDDYCNVKMSLTDPLDQAASELLLERNSYTTFRNFINILRPVDGPNQGKIYSKWIPMTSG